MRRSLAGHGWHGVSEPDPLVQGREHPQPQHPAQGGWPRSRQASGLAASISALVKILTVHIGFGAAHSNQPDTSGGVPSGRARSSSRSKCLTR